MSDYLDMNCVNCGRHRVEENFVCENCGYDNKNMKYVLVSYSSQEDNETDNLSQPLLECLEHGAGTCRNEALFEALVSSGKGFRQKNKVLAEELDYLRASNGTEEIVRLTIRAEKAEAKVKEWQTVAEMLADELNECNSERRPISWEDASESSPAWIAYTNLRDRDDDE